MKVAISFPDLSFKIEADLEHTIIIADGKPKEVYKGLVKHPKTGKRYIAIFDPATGEVSLKEM